METANKRRRRGTGEGTVFRTADGRWRASVDLGWSGGKRQRKYLSGKTQAEVIRKLRTTQRAIEGGTPAGDGRLTVESFLNWWMSTVLPGTVKQSTGASYRIVVDSYIVPYVGKVRLAKLGPADVQGMLRALEDSGKSPRTRQYARSVLRRALGQAERQGMVARNVASLVDGPQVAGAKLSDVPSAEDAALILKAAEGDRLEAAVVVALTLGLRRGELLGLRWADIDLVERTLTIARTITRVAGQGIVESTPKTEAGKRSLPLPAHVADALRHHRERQDAERDHARELWEETGYVFTTAIGTLIDPGNLLHWWYGLCTRAGIRRCRFHASRHAAATMMLAKGVPLEVVSAVLGHAGLAVTADVYARPSADAKRRALDAVGQQLGYT
jgi:integrase